MASNELRLDGKAIVVTGAGRGVGRSHALLLASRGALVVVADSGVAMDGSQPSEDPAAEVAAEIKAAGGVATICTDDLSTAAGSAAAVQASIQAFGRVDGLLHNASIAPQLFDPAEVPDDRLDLMMRVNVYAAFWLTRAAWPHMKRQGGGRIAFTSAHAIYGTPGMSTYCAAKSAFLGMARCLAADGKAHNILTNVLVGGGRSRMVEQMPPSAYRDWMMATMDPEHVSVSAAFLLSDACRANGESYSISGGRIARITLSESEGLMGLETIEDVRDQIDIIDAQQPWISPHDSTERARIVHRAMGFDGALGDSAYDIQRTATN